MTGLRHRLLAIITLALLVLPVTAQAQQSWDLEGATGWGYDNNINRLGSKKDQGGYLPFDFLVRHHRDFDEQSRLQAKVRGKGRLYTGSNSDFNDTKLGADLRYDRRLVGSPRRRVLAPSLDFHARATAEIRHTTYFSRTTGQELVVIGPDGPVFLNDRYDSRRYYAETGLTLRQPRGTRWTANLRLHRRNYINDYNELPTVDALDYDNLRLTLRIRQKLSKVLDADLRYDYSATDYDTWRARDFDGNKVDGEFQSFRYHTFTLRVTARKRKLGRLGLELYNKERSDPFQGYYNYSEKGIAPHVVWQPDEHLAVELRFRYFHRTYEKARVKFNPVRDLREDFDSRFELNLDYNLDDHRRIFVVLINDDVREADPFYTYTRLRSAVGFAVTN